MKIVILGGNGRLGRRVAPKLLALRHEVLTPTRIEVNATNMFRVRNYLDEVDPDLVISMVAHTRVSDSEKDSVKAWESNVVAAVATARACNDADVPFAWISTDYIFSHGGPHNPWDKPDPCNVYGETKSRGEMAIIKHSRGGVVVRMCFVDDNDVFGYSWLNGYTKSSREWVSDAAQRLVDWVESHDFDSPVRVVHLVSSGQGTTVAEMAMKRWPNHGGAICVTLQQIQNQAGLNYAPPSDTRLAQGVWIPDDV